MTALVAFLQDLAGDERMRRSVGLHEHLMQELLAEAQALEELQAGLEAAENSGKWLWPRDWIIARPVEEPAFLGRVILNAYRDSWVSRPRCIRRVGEEFWVGGEMRIARFAPDWQFRGQWGNYGDPRPDQNVYGYHNDFCVDEERGRLFVVSGWHHIARCFDLATGQHIWTYGDFNVGHYADGRLWGPYSIELLPSGNVAVCSVWGDGELNGQRGNGNRGFLVEIDGATGAAVACRGAHVTSGQPWDGEIDRPRYCRLSPHDGLLWVSAQDNDQLVAYDPATWEVARYIVKPANIDVQRVYPVTIGFSAAHPDEVFVHAEGPQRIVRLNVQTGDYLGSIGYWDWDDRAAAAELPRMFNYPACFLFAGDRRMVVADTGNNRIIELPLTGRFTWRYALDIPDGYKIVHAPKGWDSPTQTLTLSAKEAAERIFLDPQALKLLLLKGND